MEHDRYGFLLTERQIGADIFIPGDLLHGGKTGDKSIVKIVDWPEDTKSPRGEVVDVLGQEGENDTEMHAILAEYGLPYTYPENVERAADKLHPGITEEEIMHFPFVVYQTMCGKWECTLPT